MNDLGINLDEIVIWLQRGKDRAKIAKDTGRNVRHVQRVLAGEIRDFDVIEKAIELAIDRKSRIISKMESLKQLQ